MKLENIEALAESYINGNISYVKKKVQTMSKVDFVSLLTVIRAMGETHHFLYLATVLTR